MIAAGYRCQMVGMQTHSEVCLLITKAVDMSVSGKG